MALARRQWTPDQWRNIIWSDECFAERGKGKRPEWVFRTPSQKWLPEMVQTYSKGRDMKCMVWGLFWYIHGLYRRSELVVMGRDEESKKGGYSHRSYLQVLRDQMPKCWEPGLIFMQDNAPIHTAQPVASFFQDEGIPTIDWPPYSPDLNPIEHTWFRLKEQVLLQHPELSDMGDTNEAFQALGDALIEAWEALPNNLFESLGESMQNRVKAVITSRGWHTKY